MLLSSYKCALMQRVSRLITVLFTTGCVWDLWGAARPSCSWGGGRTRGRRRCRRPRCTPGTPRYPRWGGPLHCTALLCIALVDWLCISSITGGEMQLLLSATLSATELMGSRPTGPINFCYIHADDTRDGSRYNQCNLY